MPLPDTFENDLYKLLREQAPLVVTTEDTWEVGQVVNHNIWKNIREKLAWWLSLKSEEDALSELQKLNSPSQICGHVFKAGEATFTCRECAVDPTCVFCQSCFRQSEHRNHKHKLHSSGGGGCCDCGDTEAWNKYPSCSQHSVVSDTAVADSKARLPETIRSRAEPFFMALLEYITESLVTDPHALVDLPEKFNSTENEDRFVTVLYNDESHTFDYVIDILQKATQCSETKAADFATCIDREGRAVIKIGTSVECNDCASRVQVSPPPLFRSRVHGPLKTKILHSTVFAYQEIALWMFAWLEKLAKQSDGLRLILSECMLAKVDVNKDVCVTRFMLYDIHLWKAARNAYQQFVMGTMLLQNETKKSFAVQYVRCYNDLVSDFLEDDHDYADSIISISVQIFTVPTLVKHLMLEENMLTIVLDTMIKLCCSVVDEGNVDNPSSMSIYKLDVLRMKKSFRRTLYPFYDLKYVLTNVPTEWDPVLNTKFQAFFRKLLAFLASLERMDAVVRKVDRHIEHEPEWETGITLLMRLIPVFKPLYKWCTFNKSVLVECLQQAMLHLKNLHQRESDQKEIAVTYNNKTYTCVDCDITEAMVSIHIPLTRLTAALLVQCTAFGLTWHEAGVSDDILKIGDNALQTICLCAQTSAGAWRRNGMSLANQVFYCRDYRCREEAFNRDLLMLQVCAAVCDPDLFFVSLYNRMCLHKTELLGKYIMSIYEEFVSLLIYICVERWTKGVGQVTSQDIARREIIHVLASGPRPHSKLSKHLPDEVTDEPGWESVLIEVADYKPALSSTSVARYELKDAFMSHVSPCYYHYNSASDQTNAQNEITRRKKSASQSLAFTPVASPPFTEPFDNVINLLVCSSLQNFINDLLSKLSPDASTPVPWSDKLFEKILYLIGFSVLEERERVKKDQNSTFRFCETADKAGGLLETLRQISAHEATSLHKDNLCWILNGVLEVQNRRRGFQCDDFTLSLTKHEKNERLKRKQMAEERRKKLMSQMNLQQRNFLQANASLSEAVAAAESGDADKSSSVDPSPVGSKSLTELPSPEVRDEPQMCILCQDSNQSQDCLVLSAFVQLSSVLSKDRSATDVKLSELPDMTNQIGLHMSTCSHVMHYQCWKQYFDTVKSKEERRPHRMRRFLSSFSTMKNEYLCPLCSRLSNCVIPLVPQSMLSGQQSQNTIAATEHMTLARSLEIWNKHMGAETQRVDAEMLIEMNQEEWHDATDQLPQDIPMLSQATSASVESLMDVEDPIQVALDAINKSIHKNCYENEPPEEKFLPLWLCAATTFQSAECVSRYRERPLLAPASVRVAQALSNVVRCCFALMSQNENNIYRSKLIQILLGVHSTPLLCKNIFAFFVQTFFAWRAHDQVLLHMCSVAQLVQIMLFIDETQISGESSTDSPLKQRFNQVRSYAKLPAITEICDKKLEECILTSFRPFIRSCVLFMRYARRSSPPSSLQEADDYRLMLKYLGLPADLPAFFDVPEASLVDRIVQRWCSQPELVERCSLPTQPSLKFPQLSEINTLVCLETEYSDMIAKAASFSCPRFRSEDDSVSPTLCLICGQMLCSQSYCCQQSLDGTNVGACTYHNKHCSFNFGMFLKVRDCNVVLLNDTRGSYRSAPYLDEYGETDQGLRRGNPLTLDDFRRKELNLVWLEHAVAENIVRDLEANRGFSNVDWIHF